MNIVVNGDATLFRDEGTLGEWLRSQKIDPGRVAVMVNGKIIKKDVRDVTTLHEGDQIEILTLMGGG